MRMFPSAQPVDYNPLDAGETEKAHILAPGDPLTFANIALLSIDGENVDSAGIRGGALARTKKSTASSRSRRASAQGRAGNISIVGISDWDDYGKIPKILPEYERAIANIEGSGNWNWEQKKIHKLIYMRGLHPMIPSWWRMNFKMWGITQAELDDVFTPIKNPRRVVIHAYGNEVAAGKALEALFYLSQTVKDSEQIGEEEKIAPKIVKGIKAYYKWALRDAGLQNFRVKRTFIVREYQPDFFQRGIQVDGEMDIDLTDEERQQQFTDAVSKDLEARLARRAQKWRTLLWDSPTRTFTMHPPTLYAFAVVQHIVMLVSLDSADAKNPVIILDQIRFNDRGAWLWNALSVAIPISIIRDAIHWHQHPKAVVPKKDKGVHDPDA